MLINDPKALVTTRARSCLRTGVTMHQMSSKAIKTPRCEGGAYIGCIRRLNFCKY
jgi:hypothetical protein